MLCAAVATSAYMLSDTGEITELTPELETAGGAVINNKPVYMVGC